MTFYFFPINFSELSTQLVPARAPIEILLFLSKTFQFEWKKFKIPCEIVANIGLLSEGSDISRLSALKGRGISMSYTKS